MKAKSIKGKSTEEIQSALQESMADGFKPTLAIIFLSISQNRKDIAEILSKVGVQILVLLPTESLQMKHLKNYLQQFFYWI